MFLSWVLYIAQCILKGRQRKTKTKSTHPRFIQKNMNKAERLPCFRKWMDEPRDPGWLYIYNHIYIYVYIFIIIYIYILQTLQTLYPWKLLGWIYWPWHQVHRVKNFSALSAGGFVRSSPLTRFGNRSKTMQDAGRFIL